MGKTKWRKTARLGLFTSRETERPHYSCTTKHICEDFWPQRIKDASGFTFLQTNCIKNDFLDSGTAERRRSPLREGAQME